MATSPECDLPRLRSPKRLFLEEIPRVEEPFDSGPDVPVRRLYPLPQGRKFALRDKQARLLAGELVQQGNRNGFDGEWDCGTQLSPNGRQPLVDGDDGAFQITVNLDVDHAPDVPAGQFVSPESEADRLRFTGGLCGLSRRSRDDLGHLRNASPCRPRSHADAGRRFHKHHVRKRVRRLPARMPQVPAIPLEGIVHAVEEDLHRVRAVLEAGDRTAIGGEFGSLEVHFSTYSVHQGDRFARKFEWFVVWRRQDLANLGWMYAEWRLAGLKSGSEGLE